MFKFKKEKHFCVDCNFYDPVGGKNENPWCDKGKKEKLII